MGYIIDIEGVLTKYNTLPRIWNGATGYRGAATAEQIYNDGFRELTIPTITVYQKLGDIYYVPIVYEAIPDTDPVEYSDVILEIDYYTYQIVDFTQQEIDDYDEQVLATAVIQEEDKREADGQEAYKWIREKIRRNKNDGTITPAQFKTLRKNLLPIVIKLNYGGFDVVLDELDAAIPNIPAGILLTIANTIRTKVNDYIIANPE